METVKRFLKNLVALQLYRTYGESLWEQQRGILILMYHEVAPKRDGRFRLFPVLCTTPETFRQQVAWLRKHFEIISMDEAEERLRNGTAGDSRAVVVTSDDGWSGFYEQAIALGVKTTVYVTTCVLEGKLPWYVRWRILLREKPHLLKTLAHELGRFDPFEDADEALKALKRLDVARIDRLWKELGRESGFSIERLPRGWYMKAEQVQRVPEQVTIGAHTVNHPQLTKEYPEVALREMQESKRVLEELTGRAVQHFAYPNGDHNEGVVQLAEEAGYATAVTTVPGWNLPGDHLYRLKRVDVHEAACVDHFGRFSEAMFAVWVTGEWDRVRRRLRFL